MGGLFAGLMAGAGIDVGLLENSEKRVDTVRKHGLKIRWMDGSSSAFSPPRVKITARPRDIGKVGLLLVFVKAYDTEKAIKNALPLLDKETIILTLQNGLGNVEAIKRVAKRNGVIAGITSHGANVDENGLIRHAGTGETIIGCGPKAVEIASLLNSAGIGTRVSKRISDVIWTKLLINAAINPLTAATRLKNGELLKSGCLRDLMKTVACEVESVARKKGIRITNPSKKVESVCRATAENVSSMLQDIVNHRKTEIDFINGAVVREAEKLSVPVPSTTAMWKIVKSLECVITKSRC